MPPPVPTLASGCHDSSWRRAAFASITCVPPHASTNGLDAGKLTCACPSQGRLGSSRGRQAEALSPDETHTVIPRWAALSNTSFRLSWYCFCIRACEPWPVSNSGPPQLSERTEMLADASWTADVTAAQRLLVRPVFAEINNHLGSWRDRSGDLHVEQDFDVRKILVFGIGRVGGPAGHFPHGDRGRVLSRRPAGSRRRGPAGETRRRARPSRSSALSHRRRSGKLYDFANSGAKNAVVGPGVWNCALGEASAERVAAVRLRFA